MSSFSDYTKSVEKFFSPLERKKSALLKELKETNKKIFLEETRVKDIRYWWQRKKRKQFRDLFNK